MRLLPHWNLNPKMSIMSQLFGPRSRIVAWTKRLLHSAIVHVGACLKGIQGFLVRFMGESGSLVVLMGYNVWITPERVRHRERREDVIQTLMRLDQVHTVEMEWLSANHEVIRLFQRSERSSFSFQCNYDYLLSAICFYVVKWEWLCHMNQT